MVGLFAWLFVLGHPVASPMPAPAPGHVVGGQVAQVCDWPATVSVAGAFGEHICTASLIHPRLVLVAAHCVAEQFGAQTPDSALFGESTFDPEVTVPVTQCLPHPDYSPAGALFDLAVCELEEAAPPVPIVPLLTGCEADQLEAEAEVTLVGYGMDDDENFTGTGTKRWATNTVEIVDNDNNDLFVLGVDNASACFGDSGGPAYLQLRDGSWRIAGVTSTPHPEAGGDPCGYGAVYDLIHPQIEWLESATGVDLSPCHDTDGTWNPDERCDAFPMTLTDGSASWARHCATEALSGPGAACGDPFVAEGTTGTTGGSESSSSGAPAASESSDSGGLAGTGAGTTTAETSTTGEAAGDGGGGGCGCHAPRRDPPGWALAVLGLIGGCPRKRPGRRWGTRPGGAARQEHSVLLLPARVD